MSQQRAADICVIGGGAAGMMAAAEAARLGADVLLIEKNDVTGKKLLITGKGRCNVTNDSSVKELVANTPVNGKFMYPAFSRFTAQDTMRYFERLGVALKTERGRRVFPVSDKAADVAEALRKQLRSCGVRQIKAKAQAIRAEEGKVSGVSAAGEVMACRAVILATGGCSYPATGSDGSGYAMARSLGHTVVPPSPSLVPLVSPDEDCARMQGLALKNVNLTVISGDGKKVYSEQGELLFTHFGVSGPLILSASAHMRDFKNERYTLSIDLKPALDEKTLDARILRDFAKYSNRDFSNSLSELLPRLMIPVIVRRSGIAPDTKVNSVTREDRRRLLELLKDLRIEVTGTRPIAEAIVTSGGVDVKEIDPRTMESKLVKGLFFAGEIIDADAYTGGFNLQIAWSSAQAAAAAAARMEEQA